MPFRAISTAVASESRNTLGNDHATDATALTQHARCVLMPKALQRSQGPKWVTTIASTPLRSSNIARAALTPQNNVSL
jgi:hypothetical protein